MAVYHFTLHAYQSWMPDHPRGWVKRGEGVQKPDPELATEWRASAQAGRVYFTRDLQAVLVWGAYDCCARLHAVGTDPGHVHLVVSWRHYAPYQRVMDKLKNVLSYLLGRATSRRGRRWFVRDGSHRRVTNRSHLDYLIREYLPDHRGVFSSEDRPPPACPPCLK